MIINSFGIMRSGIHCILGWIIQNLENDSVNFYNNIKNVNDLNNRLIKKTDTRIDDIRDKITENKSKNIIKSFESKNLEFYKLCKDEINIIIIRNPYNNLSSSIKYTKNHGEHPDIKINENFDNLWIKYSNLFIENNNFIKILFDKFITDETYRIEISKKIGFKLKKNTLPYLKMGGGSSFLNINKVLLRQDMYINNKNLIRIKNNIKITKNWNLINNLISEKKI